MFDIVSVSLPLPVPTVQFVVVWWIVGSLTAAAFTLPLYGATLLITEWDDFDKEYEVHVPKQTQPLWLVALAYWVAAAAWPVVWVEFVKGGR